MEVERNRRGLFNIIYQHLPGGTVNRQKTSSKAVGAPTEIRAKKLPNTSHKRYLFSQHSWLYGAA
jgi:hypothetical protein